MCSAGIFSSGHGWLIHEQQKTETAEVGEVTTV